MPPRFASGERDSGKRRLRRQAKLVRVKGRGKTPSSSHRRPWGMPAWLAVLRVFRFRTPLSGDHTARQIMRRRPGSLAVPLWPKGRSNFHGSFTGSEFQEHPMISGHSCWRGYAFHCLTEARCECGQNDIFGRHRAACPSSGRLKRRAVPTERTVCRKAGATVTRHVKLRDMNVQV